MALQSTLETVWLGLLLSSLWKVAESKDQVFQPSTVVSLEGAVAEISCNHSISNGSRPSQQGRYNMTYKRFSLSLLILQVQMADAGVYYCALRYTEAGNP
ncbi:hypothetical protein FD754_023213 [Muntiacus muntjak]|uniref:Immunoglobulin V-set domain-containing protein n=1 Tax=Muntiacus muntjak TaxID=9888 RepID=A0A5N3UV46_MUNMU|nr:hypothetical protein FD754_023214 [Muntiacus muntjak]KAB0340345.1 hypothetical protein FD754_023213 [Muntiacus muntjak]